MGDCLKELEETSYWPELLIDAELLAADRLSPHLEECNELIAIMTTIANKIKARSK